MAKPGNNDSFTTILTSVVVVLLLAMFVSVWYYRSDRSVKNERVSYAIVGPMVVSNDEYAVRTRLALQTSKGDADWATKNQPLLRSVIESTLRKLDPVQVRAPGGLQRLQEALTEAANKALDTDKIEQILLTDFLLQTDV